MLRVTVLRDKGALLAAHLGLARLRFPSLHLLESPAQARVLGASLLCPTRPSLCMRTCTLYVCACRGVWPRAPCPGVAALSRALRLGPFPVPGDVLPRLLFHDKNYRLLVPAGYHLHRAHKVEGERTIAKRSTCVWTAVREPSLWHTRQNSFRSPACFLSWRSPLLACGQFEGRAE